MPRRVKLCVGRGSAELFSSYSKEPDASMCYVWEASKPVSFDTKLLLHSGVTNSFVSEKPVCVI